MECSEIKDLIPDFLSGDLEEPITQQILAHISHCNGCKKEIRHYKESWEILGKWEEAEPERGYIGRFWRRVAQEKNWPKEILNGLKGFWENRKLYPVYATIFVLIITWSLTLPGGRQNQTKEQVPADMNLSREEAEIIDNLDVIEDLEILQDLEFLRDLEIIASLNGKNV